MAAAIKVQTILESGGITTYLYEGEVPYYGKAWNDFMLPSLAASNAVVLVYSARARDRPGVRREMGYLIELQERGHGRAPELFVVVAEDLPKDHRPIISLVRGDGSQWSGRTLEPLRSETRLFTLLQDGGLDRRERLLESLQIRFMKFGTGGSHPVDLPPDWVDLYFRLFPNEDERDPPLKIMDWLAEAHLADRPNALRKIVVTGEYCERCLAFADVGRLRDTDWLFGNYFGVDAPWRGGNPLTKYFLEAVIQQSVETFPDQNGVLFEVEKFDETLADELASRLEGTKDGDSFVASLSEDELQTVRAVERVWLFMKGPQLGANHARILADGEGRPIEYRQPAMDAPLSEDQEVALWIMVIPTSDALLSRLRAGENSANVEEVLSAVQGMFRRAYGVEEATRIPGYRPYFEDYKMRLAERLRVFNGEEWERGTWSDRIPFTVAASRLWSALMRYKVRVPIA